MLTIRTLEKIKLGSRITFYNGIFAILCGIAYIGLMKFLAIVDFEGINAFWNVFSKYNPEISSLYFKLMIMKAIFMIFAGISIIYLSMDIMKRKEKVTWINLFLLGLIFWPSFLIIEIFNKNIFTIAISLIGWLSFLIGMIFPIRYFMQDDYSEE